MKTTASSLLDLVFEGHSIRTVVQDGQPLFVAKDVADACGILSYRDIIKQHVSPENRLCFKMSANKGAKGARNSQSFMMLRELGIFQLVLGSRKPVARRIAKMLGDEIMPQISQHGSYFSGDTPQERMDQMKQRMKELRAEITAEKLGRL
jgi:anti-repressor protein